MEPIGSILLAAGEGRRLRPLTEALPKPALPVLDVPLGAWGLSELLRHRAPIIVNASRRAEELRERLGAIHRAGWTLFEEGDEGYGTAGTIAALADRLDERVVVHNADLVTDLDSAHLMETHIRTGAGITLAVREVDGGGDFDVAGGEVKRFVDRRRDPSGGSAQYLGVAVVERQVAERISKTRPLGLGESVLAPLAKRGWLATHVHRGYALDVGTIDRYVRANVDSLQGTAPKPPAPWPGEVIDVPGGRAYLGPGASAATGSLGHGAVVLRDAHVLEGAHVERAMVFEGETVAAGNDVRGTVWFRGAAIRGSSSRPVP